MRAILVLVPLILVGAALAHSAAEPVRDDKKPAPVDYKNDVAPMLDAKCVRCHKPQKADGKLDMTTRAAMLKGGISGPAIAPGSPDKSLIVELIHFNEMPPKNVKIRVTKDELKLLKAWIEAGAPE